MTEETLKLRQKLIKFRKKKEKILSKLDQELKELNSQCEHELQIILKLYYDGSYSYSYNEWYEELRQCLICGYHEYGKKDPVKNTYTKFDILKNPKYRAMHDYPLPNDFLTMSNKDLMEFVNSYTYKE